MQRRSAGRSSSRSRARKPISLRREHRRTSGCSPTRSPRSSNSSRLTPAVEGLMSSLEQGLSGAEAARRLAAYGPNEPAPVRRLSAIVQLFHLFANPLVIILLVASVIAGSLGQHVDALIIVTMVVLGVTINFWQSYRSQQAAERLRSSVIPTATVLRDGAWLETPMRNVVPGDVFRLSAGDLVPADAQLLESRNLSVQQSMLTGESLPADKEASAAAPEGTIDPNAPHL